eukprot:ANDGO_06641.mRNA.1 hypothetical protein
MTDSHLKATISSAETNSGQEVPDYGRRIQSIVAELGAAVRHANVSSDADLVSFLSGYFTDKAEEQKWRGSVQVSLDSVDRLVETLCQLYPVQETKENDCCTPAIPIRVLSFTSEAVGIGKCTVSTCIEWCFAHADASEKQIADTAVPWAFWVFIMASFATPTEFDCWNRVKEILQKHCCVSESGIENIVGSVECWLLSIGCVPS